MCFATVIFDFRGYSSIMLYNLFTPILSRYLPRYYFVTTKNISKAFGCGKYDPRSFNSVRLLREIETRIDFVGFETRDRIAIGKLHSDVCRMRPQNVNELPHNQH